MYLAYSRESNNSPPQNMYLLIGAIQMSCDRTETQTADTACLCPASLISTPPAWLGKKM